MSFQESAESWRAKLHVGGKRLPVLVGVTVALVFALVCAGKTLVDVIAADGFAVEKPASTTEEANGQELEEVKTPTMLVVQVGGAVVTPGVYEVAEGARVNDAVTAAGGLAPDAVLDSCNLARVVNDGEQIVVPSQADVTQDIAAGGEALSGGGQAAPITSGGLININGATVEQLDALPGVGASTAQKIVSDREANGPFKTTEDLKRVSGIGDKKFAALAELICVG